MILDLSMWRWSNYAPANTTTKPASGSRAYSKRARRIRIGRPWWRCFALHLPKAGNEAGLRSPLNMCAGQARRGNDAFRRR
jgi:hypothetical protein